MDSMPQHDVVPRFATCSFQQCSRPSVRGTSCSSCKQHLCAEHCSSVYHTCPSTSELTDNEWERVIDSGVEQLLASVNVNELLRVASSLNGGRTCTFQPGQHLGSGAIMGCANYHAWIYFDNERWLVRIPRGDFSDMPQPLVEYLIASEYATLKFLERTKVPTARAFGYGLVSDPNNRVGVNYILMEALSGTPYQSSNASETQKSFVIEQISEILTELSKYSFSRAGSLLQSSSHDDEVQVSQVASNRWVQLGLYGPYDTAESYYKDICLQYLELIADGQLYCQFPKEAFLFYNHLYQRVATILSRGELPHEFYLKHVDDKGDHILVDESYNVTGIIDWQFARVVPAREAYGPSIFTADLSAMYSAHVGLSKDDKLMAQKLNSRLPLRIVEALSAQTELVRRFHFGLASGLSEAEVHGIIAGTLALDSEFHRRAPDQIDVKQWLRQQWNALGDNSCAEKVANLFAKLAEEKDGAS